jgi:hypothetical protein
MTPSGSGLTSTDIKRSVPIADILQTIDIITEQWYWCFRLGVLHLLVQAMPVPTQKEVRPLPMILPTITIITEQWYWYCRLRGTPPTGSGLTVPDTKRSLSIANDTKRSLPWPTMTFLLNAKI